MSEITYVFKHGKTFAIQNGKVIAASTDADDVERQVKRAFGEDPHADFLDHGGGGGDPDMGYEGDYGPQLGGGGCPGCGAPNEGDFNFCPHCGEPLKEGGPGGIPAGPGGQDMENPFPHDQPSPGMEMGGEAGPYLANTVTTPNGLKGTIMGKVASTWGDEVTIRLENGRIVHLPVGTELRATKTAAAPKISPIERLEARLGRTYDGTRESLVARSQELARIKQLATHLIREGATHEESLHLNKIVVTADVEQAEIADAVAHLDDVDSYEAPGFSMGVAPDAPGISREDASWLDHTYEQMIADAEATDFTQLMDEGPETLTAELPDVALADTGVTRQMASSFIAEKTAGVDRKVAEPYIETFLARVEACRRTQLAARKQTTKKEAAAQEDQFKDLPDDSLFL